MGDRSNVKITYNTGESIYLYTHWGGSELHEVVARALDDSSRIEDESYFARFVFCRMLGDGIQDWRGETGFGIAPYAPDQDINNKMIHIDYQGARERSGAPQIDWEHEE